MKAEIQEFVNYLREEKKTSENTAVSYERDLRKFDDYLCVRGKQELNQITEDDLAAYLENLKKVGRKPSTISRSIASLKGFFEYLLQQEEVSRNLAKKLKAPKIEKKVPTILTVEEATKLLNQPSDSTPKQLRDKAMLELLYATGIRVSELISLKIEDVNLQMGYLMCQDGQKERVIPFGRVAKDAMENYLARGRDKLVDEEENHLLFTNCSGQAMSRQGFWKLIKGYAKKAGITSDITPHTLRHSFAAHLISDGADLKSVQEMMGHSDISTTQIYAQMNTNKIRDFYQPAHSRQ